MSDIEVRFVRSGPLADAYPAGAHDRELVLHGSPDPAAVRAAAEQVLADDERCRRVVLAVPEQDLPAIAFAESAGFRYVVDVETRAGAATLLVVEPDRVTRQVQDLDDIPIQA